MAVSPQITASLSAGPEDVVRPSAWLGSSMVASLQLLDNLRRPAVASDVTLVFRRPDGVEIAVVGEPSEAIPAPPRWLGACELTMAGPWAVRAVSLNPMRVVDWILFDVLEEPQDVKAPYAALWLQQNGQVTSTTTGGLISAARIDLLPLVTDPTGLSMPGVRAADGASVRLPFSTVVAGIHTDLAPRFGTIEAEIAALQALTSYVVPTVNLTASPAVVEVGEPAPSVTLTVTRNRPELPVQITGASTVTIPAGQLSIVVPGPFAADASWTATVTDPSPPPGQDPGGSDVATLSFLMRSYRGAVSSSTPSDAELAALLPGDPLTSGRVIRDSTITCGDGAHIVLLLPAAWGAAPGTIEVNGFPSNAIAVTPRTVTNAQGVGIPCHQVVTTSQQYGPVPTRM